MGDKMYHPIQPVSLTPSKVFTAYWTSHSVPIPPKRPSKPHPPKSRSVIQVFMLSIFISATN